MCPLIGLFEPRGLYPSVDLRRRNARMSEHLLDGPQVSPAVEQMRRERVPEGVRVDPSLDRSVPRPHAQAAPDIRRGQARAGLGEEERLLATAVAERRTGALDVT